MDIVKLLSDLKASLDALSLQLVDAEAAAKAAYDKGFADGVASVVVPGGPTQAELDAANEKIAALQAEIEALKAASEEAVVSAVLRIKEGAKAVIDAFEAKEDADVVVAKSEIDAL